MMSKTPTVLVVMLVLSACGSEVGAPLLNADMGPVEDVSLDVQNDQGAETDLEQSPVEDMEGDMQVDAQPDVVEEVDPFLTLPECAFPLMDAFTIDRLDPPAAASNTYPIPALSAVDAFADAVRLTIEGRYEAALMASQSVGYGICRGEGDYADTVLFEPVARGTGHAVLAIRLKKDDASRLFFQSPHILHDRNTLPQSVRFFEELKARALLTSGTHRCASSERGCSGTSAVCERADDGYAESDMAHSVTSYFQAAHEAVADAFTQDLVVSVHGMARAGVSVSNGTRFRVASDSPVARVVKALDDAGIAEVTSCSPGTVAPEVNFLCGGTNTQGRHLNGSADACFQNATRASERFLHLEQERTLRDNPTRMVNALKTALQPEMQLSQ